ncbi:hypothetical protein ACJQWK_06885 [Exserohilum turcicum]
MFHSYKLCEDLFELSAATTSFHGYGRTEAISDRRRRSSALASLSLYAMHSRAVEQSLPRMANNIEAKAIWRARNYGTSCFRNKTARRYLGRGCGAEKGKLAG